MIRDLVVELVTPAMVGGVEPRECDDPPTLRPPSLRGQLRFWTRALAGGGRNGEEWQTRLWGDTESGQRVRILGAQPLDEPKDHYLFPAKESEKKRSKLPMIEPGARALLRFAIPEEGLLAPLQAVVWTWLHLGTVGRRARRGYGSVLWDPQPGDLLEGFLEEGFDVRRDLADRRALEDYLKGSLAGAWSALGVTPEARRSSRTAEDDFVLDSLDQVFVGEPNTTHRWWRVEEVKAGSGVDVDWVSRSFEDLVHGVNQRGRGGPPEELQLGLPRFPRTGKPLPSPILWRLLPCTSEGFLPVMTWSPVEYPSGVNPQIAAGNDLYTRLVTDLKLDRSLAGNSL